MPTKKIGLLLSGGLDSVALAGHYLMKGFQIWPVYIRCGLGWEKKEIYWTRRFLTKMKHPRLKSLAVINLGLEEAYSQNWSHQGIIPGPKSHDASVFLPARNLLLIIKALLYLNSKKIKRIALATLKGNPFQDGTRTYFNQLEKILSKSFNQGIRIESPFRNQTKAQLIQKYHPFPLHLSLSCIDPHGKIHCGKCNKCMERKKAFKKSKILDQTRYA